MIQAADGNFYGTTYAGGANGLGVLFRMDTKGGVTTLVGPRPGTRARTSGRTAAPGLGRRPVRHELRGRNRRVRHRVPQRPLGRPHDAPQLRFARSGISRRPGSFRRTTETSTARRHPTSRRARSTGSTVPATSPRFTASPATASRGPRPSRPRTGSSTDGTTFSGSTVYRVDLSGENFETVRDFGGIEIGGLFRASDDMLYGTATGGNFSGGGVYLPLRPDQLPAVDRVASRPRRAARRAASS